MADTERTRLRVLTLNCWGLWLLADKRRQRIAAIADWIANSHDAQFDVIALQEVWVRADFDLIADRAKDAGMTHSRFFYSGAIGSGLGLISRHPIVSAFVSPYLLNGSPIPFVDDWFAGKAVCGITVQVPAVGKVDVLNTHMFAPGGEADNVKGAHRIAQAWDLARMAVEKAERGRHVIVMGDFNSQPHSIIMDIIRTHGRLLDAFAETHPEPPSITSAAHRSFTPLEAMHAHGITCDSPLNTYSAPKLRKRSKGDEVIIRGGKRLDYVLYRSPAESDWQLEPESTSLELTEPVPHLGVSYSDHFGLSATFTFSKTQQRLPYSLRPDLLSPALSTLHAAQRASMRSSKLQLQLFAACVLAALGLTVSSSFEPLRALNWLFTLLGVMTGAAGATFLYTGFIGGRWVAGQLKNVIAEMEAELERIRITRRPERRSVDLVDHSGWTQ
ncbi:hypothetical protein JCM8115_005041 [Rhodotorula mucilaginosa]|uniref:Phospholipase C type enzyme n=1 Tax=Rhodotorula mucilaginosa TaxID=5537 RepID=A0A9P6W908_RHOMI|nr:phospholipase C type enzyme [Rhodotorula mucilaginosa]